MFFKLILLFLLFLKLSAYELPTIELSDDKRPEIVLFSAQSVKVKEKLSYVITWKTINATDVQITYIGKVKKSGSFTITEDEYKRGAITLTASSRDNSHSDSKTINKYVEADRVAPILNIQTQEKDYY
ncbi:MAG: hypothetical protein Q9M43_10125 [Sulfurimonas sp.]|nr:hypothetical protein [Sulfurimonas sp.]